MNPSMATRRRTRAAGSGALAKFRAERRRVLRREWRDWTIMCLITVSFLGAVIETHGFVQLLSAAVFGFSIAVLLFGWFVGGNVHSLPWMWGAVGEQQTAAVLDQLGHEWVCVHA